MEFEKREKLRIMLIEKKKKIIEEEVKKKGNVENKKVYKSEVVKREMEI